MGVLLLVVTVTVLLKIGRKFYRLPKDDNLMKKWLQNIKRENLPKTPTLCQLHFKEHCFKRDLEGSKIDLS